MNWLRRFFAWLFGPKQVTRDVARLPDHSGGRAPDVVKEVVQTGGPVKPNYRRLAVRDARLLPDRSRKGGWTGLAWRAPTSVMTGKESRRLFSNSLRTRNRNLRTLATDEKQLARYGLPLWRTETELAAALNLSIEQLRHFSIHRVRDRVPHYVAFAIPKRSGGERVIHAPKKKLKAVLRNVNDQLVSRLPVHAAAHGFVKGRSVKTNAEPHVRRAVVVKLDLEDFFPTVTWARVRGLLISLGYGYPVAAALASLMTESERQPVTVDGQTFHVPVGDRVCVQGAPMSPGLCNAVTRKMDARLSGLSKKLGFTYSRYADDLTFSGDDAKQIETLLNRATRIIHTEGFVVNGKKTRVMRSGNSQKVAGVTVNETLGLSRKERRKIRAALHQATPEKRAQLEGTLAWVHMLNPEQAAKLKADAGLTSS